MKEPSNTCPDIDSVIKSIKSVIQLSHTQGTETEDELFSLLGDIHDELYWGESTLEDLRSANEGLREWGKSQEDRADEAEDTIQDLQKELENIEIA